MNSFRSLEGRRPIQVGRARPRVSIGHGLLSPRGGRNLKTTFRFLNIHDATATRQSGGGYREGLGLRGPGPEFGPVDLSIDEWNRRQPPVITILRISRVSGPAWKPPPALGYDVGQSA